MGIVSKSVESGLIISASLFGAGPAVEYYAEWQTDRFQGELNEVIDEIVEEDSEVLEIIGEDRVCHIGAYTALRSQDAFPVDEKEIADLFRASCEDETRLNDRELAAAEAYMNEISDLVERRVDYERDMTTGDADRFVGGITLGMMTLTCVLGYEGLRGNSRKQKFEKLKVIHSQASNSDK